MFMKLRLASSLIILVCAAATAAAQPLPAAFGKPVPSSVEDLQEIEQHVQKLVEKLTPATVCLRIGASQGSGVIVNAQGTILTAGHVTEKADRDATVILHDGARLKGRTRGANGSIDSGMAILAEAGNYPHAEMAKSADVKKGDWCLALGHPNGFKPGRPPVVRLGRVQETSDKLIVTDCALVGGDSGGPLFDMHGRVIGIHSRIGGKVSSNVHVPIDTYRDTWDRLAQGDVWGSRFPFFEWSKPGDAYLGVQAAAEKKSLKIESVTPSSPAEKAGLKAGDVILKIDNLAPATVDDLSTLLKMKQPGNTVNIQVQRGNERMMIAVVLGKRS
jgi:serine protease Do